MNESVAYLAVATVFVIYIAWLWMDENRKKEGGK